MKRLLIILSLISFAACQPSHLKNQDQLTMIHIVDRGGQSETINQKEKLRAFQEVDFFGPQPYQKVTRVLQKDKAQQARSIITTYHSNGTIHEYLEAKASRANGKYKEWYPSGKIKINATVIEGLAELNEFSKRSFVFDGLSEAYYESGSLKAAIPYQKGKIDGVVNYYFENGTIERTIPYRQDMIHGKAISYAEDGSILGFTTYFNGKKDGHTLFYGDSFDPAFEEWYEGGMLKKGIYYNKSQQIESSVTLGYGKQTIFEHGVKIKEVEYKNGVPEGTVKTYYTSGHLQSVYEIRDGMKQGEEWVYYDNDKESPKVWMNWYKDELHGVVKTWYSDGSLESQKEMIHNQKQGSLTAWFRTGGVMLMEEYDHDRLVNGTYYSKATQEKISEVNHGNGTATIHDPEGYFLQKVRYEKGNITSDR